MTDWRGTPEDGERGAPPRRSWSFTFGPSDREMQGLADAARSEGVEPVVNVGRYQLDVGQLARFLFERVDPWRPLRQALALVRATIVFGLLAGGVAIGYLDASVGPIWGGIYGLVFAAFFYRMTKPRGLAT